jgi:hypothetical protein
MPHHTAHCEDCGQAFEKDRLLYHEECDLHLCEECSDAHNLEFHTSDILNVRPAKSGGRTWFLRTPSGTQVAH